ncbi:UbiA prenyltransferase family-domain-containing protein [Myxozyma melibiosi]|uniref:4-hydroxybenzoate polyprenyltransferase, mitochondrial n=1 Tax=Myxozyma melibiosi TaxID=54550 RepID=A0ABR1F3Z1_9ASCO
MIATGSARIASSRTTNNCAASGLVGKPSPALVLATSVLNSRQVSTTTTAPPPPAAPAPQTSWLLRNLPAKAVPYAQLIRIDKPVGTWLLYWPCTWGIAMAAAGAGASVMSTVWTLSLFGIGALVMRGVGCIANDFWDRDLDTKVIRTAGRPLAAGQLSVRQASVFLVSQLFLGLAVLLSLPLDCFLLGASSLGFVATYPLFKRFTYYPQLMLALTYNWGAMLGFPAMHVWDPPTMAALYGAGICWTLVYDTIYAHQDKRDDVKAGIKSTALAWGDKTKTVASVLTVVQLGLLASAGVTGSVAGPLFFSGLAWAAYRLGRMIYHVDLDDPADCWKWFVDNIKTGGVIFFAIASQYLYDLFVASGFM